MARKPPEAKEVGSGGDGLLLGPLSAGETPARPDRPIPGKYCGVQVNSCRTPGCENFGVPPRLGPALRVRGSGRHDVYRLSGMGDGTTGIVCRACGRGTRLRSNRAEHEERLRQCWALRHPSPLRCPDEACASHAALAGGASAREVFQRFGKTRGGSSRFRRRECRRTFSVGGPTLRQRRPRVNAQVLRHLVNKAPLSRIAELDEISFPALHGKVEHLHRQCALFTASREARLPGMDLVPMTLATDRQDYLVNWSSQASRRTIQLTAVATADRRSGYLLGLVPNVDPDVDAAAVEAAQEASGDAAKPPHMRDFAR